MAIWGLQYIKDATTNTLRIARAIGGAGVAGNSWIYYDFTPQQVGFASGVWFDYPSMTVAGNFLYVTSNAFTTATNAFAGNVVMRLPLSNLAAGTGFSFNYFRSNIGTERVTEGAGTTAYWLGFTTTSQMRIHVWPEASNTVTWDNVNLNAFNYLNRDGIATSPDGTNWALRADSRPTAAYVSGGVIGAMWTAKQGAGRPKPYVVHARFSEATRALLSQSDIWNNDYAWMYPSASPNAAGYLAGTLQIGGAASGTFAYPGTQVWITDDVTGASNTVGALAFVSAGNDGPNNNAWGDYFSTRRHKVRTNTWVGASHTLQGGGNGANTVPKYFWFGRERDNPTPSVITSPPPGSTLAGSSVTFNWTSVASATRYLAVRRHDRRRVRKHLESGSGHGDIASRDRTPGHWWHGLRQAVDPGRQLGLQRLHLYRCVTAQGGDHQPRTGLDVRRHLGHVQLDHRLGGPSGTGSTSALRASDRPICGIRIRPRRRHAS